MEQQFICVSGCPGVIDKTPVDKQQFTTNNTCNFVMSKFGICALFKQLDHDLKHAHELRQAAFKLYASLGANDEDIRKKVSL